MSIFSSLDKAHIEMRLANHEGRALRQAAWTDFCKSVERYRRINPEATVHATAKALGTCSSKVKRALKFHPTEEA